MTKILIAHDSALTRQVLYDIITKNVDEVEIRKSFEGESALKNIIEWKPDFICLDMYLQKKNGFEILNELIKKRIFIKTILMGTIAQEDKDASLIFSNRDNIVCMSVPYRILGPNQAKFEKDFLSATRKLKLNSKSRKDSSKSNNDFSNLKVVERVGINKKHISLIAIASSTGGPQALHRFIPKIKKIGIPIVVVQHMPKGFTYSLAERINAESYLTVKEATDNELLKPDCVYISPGGLHLEIIERNKKLYTKVFDAPAVNSLKPCADLMYRSLIDTSIDEVLCVVLTGMGKDGTDGIMALSKKKKVRVITESKSTCIVYGMPRSIDESGLSDISAGIDDIAKVIVDELEG